MGVMTCAFIEPSAGGFSQLGMGSGPPVTGGCVNGMLGKGAGIGRGMGLGMGLGIGAGKLCAGGFTGAMRGLMNLLPGCPMMGRP